MSRIVKRDRRLDHLAESEREVLKRLGARISDVRVNRAEQTLATLAAVAGVDPSYLGELERGRANPSIAVVSRIAKALNVSLLDLMAE